MWRFIMLAFPTADPSDLIASLTVHCRIAYKLACFTYKVPLPVSLRQCQSNQYILTSDQSNLT